MTSGLCFYDLMRSQQIPVWEASSLLDLRVRAREIHDYEIAMINYGWHRSCNG